MSVRGRRQLPDASGVSALRSRFVPHCVAVGCSGRPESTEDERSEPPGPSARFARGDAERQLFCGCGRWGDGYERWRPKEASSTSRRCCGSRPASPTTWWPRPRRRRRPRSWRSGRPACPRSNRSCSRRTTDGRRFTCRRRPGARPRSQAASTAATPTPEPTPSRSTTPGARPSRCRTSRGSRRGRGACSPGVAGSGRRSRPTTGRPAPPEPSTPTPGTYSTRPTRSSVVAGATPRPTPRSAARGNGSPALTATRRSSSTPTGRPATRSW